MKLCLWAIFLILMRWEQMFHQCFHFVSSCHAFLFSFGRSFYLSSSFISLSPSILDFQTIALSPPAAKLELRMLSSPVKDYYSPLLAGFIATLSLCWRCSLSSSGENLAPSAGQIESVPKLWMQSSGQLENGEIWWVIRVQKFKVRFLGFSSTLSQVERLFRSTKIIKSYLKLAYDINISYDDI